MDRAIGAATPPTSPGMRRAPVQRRGRERVERLLAAAASLIAEGGSDAMRMSDVAERAGVSIGSLYQYFPDKAAILRTLAERFNAQGRACVEAELAEVRDLAGLRAAFARLVDECYAMFLAEPVMRDIWSGTQADRALREMDDAEGRVLGAMLAEVVARLRPEADRAELAATALLLMQLTWAAVRFAISIDRTEGDAVIAAFKRLAQREALFEG